MQSLPSLVAERAPSSNLDDHILQARGIAVQHFALFLAHDNRVRVPKTAPVRIVNPRLTAESHALPQHCLIALGNPGSFVAFETNAVPGTMSEELLKPCLANLIQTLLVHFLGHCAF